MKPKVFVTGGTGFLGAPLIASLLARSHDVTALAREASVELLPYGARVLIGNALNAASYATQMPRDAVFVHLVGVAHPSPAKAKAFDTIDLAALRASLAAAQQTGAVHFVYVSVAHPAPIMRAYIASRTAAEDLIRASGIPATLLRPWYVLGPGHRWPFLLIPAYWLAERLPFTRETARRLGLVNRAQMVRAMVKAVETQPKTLRIVEVPEIKREVRYEGNFMIRE